VWAILDRYQKWLTTATRLADGKVAALQVGPLLVLNGRSDKQQKVFYDAVPVGAKLLAFQDQYLTYFSLAPEASSPG
jgi:hypothetical protein